MDEEPFQSHSRAHKPNQGQMNQERFSLGSDRFSNSSKQDSIHPKRPSLIQVVSVDGGDDKYDIYEDYLIQDGKKSIFRSSNNSRMGSNNQNSMEDEQKIDRRRSSNNRFLVHECSCQQGSCLFFHCACYGTNQACINNICCVDCVKMKMQQLQRTRRTQQIKGNKKLAQNCQCYSENMKEAFKYHIESCPSGNNKLNKISKKQEHTICLKSRNQSPAKNLITSKVTCSCKKSQCLKKYCICFSNKIGCNSGCQCQNCENQMEEGENWEQKNQEIQRYSRVDFENEREEGDQIDIDQYLHEQQYEDKMMPQSMQFEHPDLKYSYHNN